jgi:hypothetical protein
MARGGRRSTSFDSSRAREAARRSVEARRARREGEVVPEDLHGWSMGRLRELAADDSNKAASVAALKELLSRSQPEKLDIGSGEARGVSLWAILSGGQEFDLAKHTLEELVYCLRGGIDPEELLPEARRLAADLSWTPKEDRRTAEADEQVWEVPEVVVPGRGDAGGGGGG